MLLLARKVGQTVVIGGNVRVTVDCIRGRVVRLRIDAPREILVDREEVWNRRARSDADRSLEENRHDAAAADAPIAARSCE